MNASSLDSLLMNCVNHSNYNDKLKSRLREKCNRSIVLKKDYKDLRNKYNILKYKFLKADFDTSELFDNNSDTESNTDSDIDNDIVKSTNTKKNSTEYNKFVIQTMSNLKTNHPNIIYNKLYKLSTLDSYNKQEYKMQIKKICNEITLKIPKIY